MFSILQAISLSYLFSFSFGFFVTGNGKSILETCLYVGLTQIVTLIVIMASQKIEKHEGQFLKRLLNQNLRRFFEKTLSNIGYEQIDPQELIGEHIKSQKSKNALYPYLDSRLTKKITQLECDFGQDIPVGSIMTDKSKFLTIYSDTRLDQTFLSKVIRLANEVYTVENGPNSQS